MDALAPAYSSDAVHCSVLVTVSVHHSRQAVALMYSGNPDLLKTSSPYTRYIGLVLPSIADSIPYEHISAIEKLHNYLFPTPVHRSPSFYNSSLLSGYHADTPITIKAEPFIWPTAALINIHEHPI